MPRLDNSFRIFNCRRCSAQVILCRACDRGNIYCSSVCATERRKETLRRAGQRYSRTFAGRMKAAARQSSRRGRLAELKEKVTHHSSKPVVEKMVSGQTETVEATDVTINTFQKSLAPAIICAKCRRKCGPFGRLEFWRSGRKFRKLRRFNGNDTGDRSGDH